MDDDVVSAAVRCTKVGCPEPSQEVACKQVTVERRFSPSCCLLLVASASSSFSSTLCARSAVSSPLTMSVGFYH